MSETQTDIFEDGTDTEPTVVGQIATIVFSAQNSFYKVLRITILEKNFDFDDDEMTVTGNFGDIQIGASYEFKGQLQKHARYGIQFVAKNYHRQATSSVSGLVAYFSSEKFPGVGKATATKIVATLGTDAIDLILDNSKVLSNIGLSEKVQTVIVDQLAKSDGMERAIIALNDFGFGSNLATTIYQKYQQETLTI